MKGKLTKVLDISSDNLDKGTVLHSREAREFGSACVGHGDVFACLDTEKDVVHLERESDGDRPSRLIVSGDFVRTMKHTTIDAWARESFDKAWADLAATFVIEFEPWEGGDRDGVDVEDPLQRWKHFLMVRGFLSPFHPERGVFSKFDAVQFVAFGEAFKDRTVEKKLSETTKDALDELVSDEDESLLSRVRIWKDGDQWCASFEPFVDIMKTLTCYGDTRLEAVSRLLTR